MAISITWDATFQAAPLGSESIANGDNRIVAFKEAVQERITREHVWGTSETQANHGLHREGSALAYVDASEPTNQPDGATALTAIDEGRLWVDTDDESLWYYSGSAWVEKTGFVGDVSMAADLAVTGDITYASKQITSANYLEGVTTQDVVFDKLDALIPTTNDSMLVCGVVSQSGVVYIVSRAWRTSSTNIQFKAISFTPNSSGVSTGSGSVTNGSAGVITVALAW